MMIATMSPIPHVILFAITLALLCAVDASAQPGGPASAGRSPATTRAATPRTVDPAPLALLDTLRKTHPRLLVLDDDVDRIAGVVQKDETAAGYFRDLRNAADAILTEPPVERKLNGPRLLAVSRAALHRVMTLAAVYRLTGESKYAERARVEMLACAAFTDWNPSHFLDVAEMTAALAIGYDWLYGGLTDEDRGTIRHAIVEKGLEPGLHGYRTGVSWSTRENNWAQVCAGGLTLGALAIADERPQLAADVIAAARDAMHKPMAMFAPDGACVEGPAYWGYATQYNVYYLAALETALGTDFNFKRYPGFAETGLFRIHTIGTAGEAFNFADAGPAVRPASQTFWFARAFNRPVYAAHDRALDHQRDALHLLWFDGRGDAKTIAELPRDVLFRRVEVACFRGAWNDPQAVYLAFKGGDNRVSHAHLDLGTFVLDAAAVRWAEELGPSDYNLPGYFGKNRWGYYRLGTAGQNTLVVNGRNQALDGKAPIVAFESNDGRAFAVADMSDGYRNEATRVRRGVALLDRKHVLIQDEVTTKEPADVAWQMHTQAKARIADDGVSATLTRDGATLSAKLLSPAGATFELAPAPPPAPQVDKVEAAQRPTMPKLVVRLAAVTDSRIVVLFTASGDAIAEPTIEPLEKWIERAPVKRDGEQR
jgi:hypothetical protein